MADLGHEAMRFVFTLRGKVPKQVRVTQGAGRNAFIASH